jgi:hypothetical protein
MRWNGGQLSALDTTQDVALGDLARVEKCFSAFQDTLQLRRERFSEVLERFKESSRSWTVMTVPWAFHS